MQGLQAGSAAPNQGWKEDFHRLITKVSLFTISHLRYCIESEVEQMNRCYAKAVEIAAALTVKHPELTVCDPHEAQTTYSTYFLILPSSVTLYNDEQGRGRIEWNGMSMTDRKSLEVRVSDHTNGHSLDFKPGTNVDLAIKRIMKHWEKA